MIGMVAWVFVLAAMAGASPAQAAKSARPDLVVHAIAVPGGAAPGAEISVSETTANRGRKVAKRSVTRFYLSKDAKRGAGDIRLKGTRAVAKLKPRKSSKGTTALNLPPVVVGSLHLLACADDLRKVRESKEANNCRATAAPLSLGTEPGTAAPTPTPAPATPGPTPSPSSTLTPTPAPAPTPSPDPDPFPEDPEPPALPASVLTQVAGVVDAPSLSSALEPNRTLLRSAGVELSSSADASPPNPPSGGIVVSPNQLLQIALDATERGSSSRVSFAEFAETMAAAGVAFDLERGANPDTSPALAMREWLSAAVKTALEHPDEEISVPLLQLTALARRQDPPVELTDPHFDPEALNLGSLDMVLLSSVLGQMVAGARADMPAPPSSPTRAAAAETNHCTWVKDTLEKHIPFAGDLFGYASGKVAGEGLNAIYEAFGQKIFGADEGTSKERVGKGLSVLGILFKIQALAMLYDSVDLKLTPSVTEIDKPNPGITTLPTYSVHADGGIRDAEWEAFKADRLDSDLAKLKDCASAMGLPLPSTLGELGGQIEKWRIGWSVARGSTRFAAGELDTMDFKGLQQEHLIPADDHSGTEDARFEVLNADEPLGTGPFKYEEAVVKAELQTDSPLALSTLIAAADSGLDPFALAGAIADVAAGWFQNVRTIDQTATVLLRYQDNANLEWTGTIEVTYTDISERNRRGDGLNGHTYIELHHAREVTQYRGVLGKSPEPGDVGVRWAVAGEREDKDYAEYHGSPRETCRSFDIYRSVGVARVNAVTTASPYGPQPHGAGLDWLLGLPSFDADSRTAYWRNEHHGQAWVNGADYCNKYSYSDEGDTGTPDGADYFEVDPAQPGADGRWRGRTEIVSNVPNEDNPSAISVRTTTYVWDLRHKESGR
jgi:hypothetical protein